MWAGRDGGRDSRSGKADRRLERLEEADRGSPRGLFDEIREKAVAWCIARAEVEEIDQLNILHATMLAMQRAVEGLSVTPRLALIDGNRCPQLAVPSAPVIQGDAQVPAIAAASILAKVSRDREMQRWICAIRAMVWPATRATDAEPPRGASSPRAHAHSSALVCARPRDARAGEHRGRGSASVLLV